MTIVRIARNVAISRYDILPDALDNFAISMHIVSFASGNSV